jgi:hypothetical protein
MIMTDRELLEVLVEKITVSQSQLSNIELKMDQMIKEQRDILYGYGRNDKSK